MGWITLHCSCVFPIYYSDEHCSDVLFLFHWPCPRISTSGPSPFQNQISFELEPQSQLSSILVPVNQSLIPVTINQSMSYQNSVCRCVEGLETILIWRSKVKNSLECSDQSPNSVATTLVLVQMYTTDKFSNTH